MNELDSTLVAALAREGIKVEIHGPVFIATVCGSDGAVRIRNLNCISQADAEDWLIENLKLEHPNSPTLRAMTGDTSVEDGREAT